MKKNYIVPEAEVVAFAKEDVITASNGETLFDWETPSIDLGGSNWSWSDEGSFKM